MSRPNVRPDPGAYLFDLRSPELSSRDFAWDALFDEPRPIELEIGSGKGLFLVNAGEARPDHHFVGIEVSRKYARRAAERIARRGLTNVRVVCADARDLLARSVPDESLRAAHIYFPDPWWKARHKKRRVVNEYLVAQLTRRLEPGALLHLVTDVKEYYEVMRTLFDRAPAFEAIPPPDPTEPTHDLDYLTNFERKYRREGRPIFRASYRRRDA
jgi:tRNA (guanine-N7-)-methyltransferase